MTFQDNLHKSGQVTIKGAFINYDEKMRSMDSGGNVNYVHVALLQKDPPLDS